MVKRIVKQGLQAVTEDTSDAIVVASYGRSGSTLLFEAIGQAKIKQRFPTFPKIGRKIVLDQIWTLSDRRLRHGVVYKTHDYPDALSKYNFVKAVFIFGSAMEAALSVYGNLERYGYQWVQEHFAHLKSEATIDDIFDRDVLGFERQLDAWTAFTGCPTLCIRYEDLWRSQKALNAFLGMEINLPPQRARADRRIDVALRSRAAVTYRALDERVRNLPAHFIAGQRESDD